MKPTVILLGADESQYSRITGLLAENGFLPEKCSNFSVLSETFCDKPVSALILDIDSVSPDNHLLRLFKRNNPDVVLLGISANSFHPDLKESMEKYIFACMLKPVDPDEVLFLLKSGCDRNGHA